MRIVIDISDLATGRADGTTRYTYELATRLPVLAPEHEWIFLTPAEPKDPYHLPSANYQLKISPWPRGWTQLRLPFELYRLKPDVLLMPIQQLPYLRPRGMRTIAVVHDLAFHEHGEQFRYKDWALLHVFSAYAAREADQLITVSCATADDMARFYGRKKNVHVIHHGVDHDRFRVPTRAERDESWRALIARYPRLRRPFILFVGQIQPRKNIEGLVTAFEIMSRTHHRGVQAHLGGGESKPTAGVGVAIHPRGAQALGMGAERSDDHHSRGARAHLGSENQERTAGVNQLVIAGGHGWLQKPILKRIDQSMVSDRIIMLGRVPDELLPALYWHAEVFVLPSYYEGFGLPIVEAMAAGCPVVTSNVSSLPEVADAAAVLVDPASPASIAAGITSALSEREQLIVKGLRRARDFSWEATAKATLEVVMSRA